MKSNSIDRIIGYNPVIQEIDGIKSGETVAMMNQQNAHHQGVYKLGRVHTPLNAKLRK